MNNQTNKTNQKGKAIASLVIGIIGVIFLFFSWTRLSSIGKAINRFSFFLYERNLKWLSIFIDCFFSGCYSPYSYLIASPLFALGIFLGVKSLKSSRKKIAILGIILCGIDLIVSLFTLFLWLAFLAVWS
jgi:hypothetical protein